jgi:Mg-chelatase subunit ChlD
MLLPLLVWAQQPSPPATVQTSAAAVPVSANGYKLTPVSFSPAKWPTIRFEFKLQNEAQHPFDELEASDIRASLDQQPVEIKKSALHLEGSEPAHAVLLIDGSGSMIDKAANLDKLRAAKDALGEFIDNFRKENTLSIYAFDADLYDIVALPTKDKELLKDKVNRFTPRLDTDSEGIPHRKFTDIYGAIDKILARASSEKVRYLIVLSDGMQDTEEARDKLNISQAAFQEYKRSREESIFKRASEKGVLIFTIAIGNKDAVWRHPDNLAYVDAETLKNISNTNEGGSYAYVDLPKLSNRDQVSFPSYQAQLTDDLKDSLKKIGQAIRYDYSLELVLQDFPRDGKEHTVEMTFPVGGTSLPAVRYGLFWSEGDSIPHVDKPEIFAVFLATAKETVMPVSLSSIYVIGLAGLGVLAVIPMITLRVQRASWARAQESALLNSMVVVQKRSAYVGKECPNDPAVPIKPGDVIVICPRCGRTHHLNCWLYAKSRCMVRYCPGELPIPGVVLKRHGIKSAEV